jgi:type I restriction enzyme S subunit
VIDGLQPYAAYKQSALLWSGRVPSHWSELRAKCFFREIDERSHTGREDLLSVSHISGVKKRSESNATMFLAKSNKGHKRCQPGDLVINTMWAWMGALGVSRQSGLVSPSYGVYRPIDGSALRNEYVHHLVRTPQYVSEYIARSTGIHSSRLRLYPDQFLRIPLVCPPGDEQAAIVRFLNYANRRIERAIQTKKKLIALLNEQKQVIIHRAVTRGLDSNVPLA